MKTTTKPAAKQIKDMTAEERMASTLEQMRLDMMRHPHGERDPR